MNQSDILFLGTIAIDISLLIVAISLSRRSLFRPASYALLVSAIFSVYIDYAVAMVKVDRILGRDGSLWHAVVLPQNINFTLDLVARVALLVAMSLCIRRLTRLGHNSLDKTRSYA